MSRLYTFTALVVVVAMLTATAVLGLWISFGCTIAATVAGLILGGAVLRQQIAKRIQGVAMQAIAKQLAQQQQTEG